MADNIIYTIGYANITRKDLYEKVFELDAALVDVRFIPFSKRPFWTQKELTMVFKNNYFHIKEFGNSNYKNQKPFIIKDIKNGLKILEPILKKHKYIFILCGCKDPNLCHRTLIAEEIKNHLNINYQEYDN